MKKILIVEDDEPLREELKTLLLNHGYQAQILTDFTKPLETILTLSPDLILLDINIPFTNGELLLKDLRKQSDIPVIMLTSRSDEKDEVLSMTYGADDYITKPYHPTLLLLRLEAVLRRLAPKRNLIFYRDLAIDLEKGTIKRGEIEIILSKNEMRLLLYLEAHKGTIVSRDDLINYLWDNMEFVDDNTLTVNMNRLRSRLEEVGLTDVIETRRGQGYILL